MAEFSPFSVSNEKLPTLMATPGDCSGSKQTALKDKANSGDRDCVSSRTVSTLATQDSEAGIYTPIRG